MTGSWSSWRWSADHPSWVIISSLCRERGGEGRGGEGRGGVGWGGVGWGGVGWGGVGLGEGRGGEESNLSLKGSGSCLRMSIRFVGIITFSSNKTPMEGVFAFEIPDLLDGPEETPCSPKKEGGGDVDNKSGISD